MLSFSMKCPKTKMMLTLMITATTADILSTRLR